MCVVATNAFDLNRSDHFFCVFHPFSVMNRCVQKIVVGRANGGDDSDVARAALVPESGDESR